MNEDTLRPSRFAAFSNRGIWFGGKYALTNRFECVFVDRLLVISSTNVGPL